MSTKHLRLRELSRETRLPVEWLRREADSGRLPVLRVGRRMMFNLELVAKALAERSTLPDRRDNLATSEKSGVRQ